MYICYMYIRVPEYTRIETGHASMRIRLRRKKCRPIDAVRRRRHYAKIIPSAPKSRRLRREIQRKERRRREQRPNENR